MSEQMILYLRTQEEYDILLEKRLPQLALVKAARYLIMFKVEGGSAEAASTMVEFTKLITGGPGGVLSDTYLQETTFTDQDYRPVFKIPGIIKEDFVRLDSKLIFTDTKLGTMQKGYVLSEDHDPDNLLDLEAQLLVDMQLQLTD